MEAVVVGTGVALDAVEKRGQVDELVTRIDELEVEEVLFARHAGRVSVGFGNSHPEEWLSFPWWEA